MVGLRKIIFLIFCALYIIVCPSLILYSLGIVIKPDKKKIIKTGVIFITTIPDNAIPYLDGKPHKEQTPTLIDNLLPGNYTLEIKKPGYQSWKTQVSVYQEKASPLEDIILLPEPMSENEISREPMTDLIPVDDNPFVIASSGDQTRNLFLHIWDESFRQNILPQRNEKLEAIKPLFTTLPDPQTKEELIKTYTVSSSPYVIFEIKTDEGRKFLWTDLLLGPTKRDDITTLFPVSPDDIHWSKEDPRYLYSLQNHTINRIDLATKAIYPQVISNAESFTLLNDTLFVLLTDRKLIKTTTSLSDDEQRLVSQSPQFNDLVTKHFPFSSLRAFTENIVVLLNRDGTFVTNLKPYLLAEEGIRGFKWNKKPQKLALWSQNRVGIFNVLKSTSDEETPITWIDYSFKHIQNTFWVNDGTHLLIEDSNQLYLADTSCCQLRDVRPVVEIKENTNTYYSPKTGKIFYIQKDTARLSSTDILSDHILFNTKPKQKNQSKDSQQP